MEDRKGNSALSRRTQLRDIIEDFFRAHDPLMSRTVIKAFNAVRSAWRFLSSRKSLNRVTTQAEVRTRKATQSSAMLTLSIHINHLITWISTVFSVAVVTNYVFSTSSPLLVLTVINCIISCCSGFYISSYLIKKLEESLSSQILSIFSSRGQKCSSNNDQV